MSNENLSETDNAALEPLYGDPDWEEAIDWFNKPYRRDSYSSLAVLDCRLRIAYYENLLASALLNVLSNGDGMQWVLRVEHQLNKTKNQLTLLERDYVGQ